MLNTENNTWDYTNINYSLDRLVPILNGMPEPTDFKDIYHRIMSASELIVFGSKINYAKDTIHKFFMNSRFSACKIFNDLIISALLVKSVSTQNKDCRIFVDKEHVACLYNLYPNLRLCQESKTNDVSFVFDETVLKVTIYFSAINKETFKKSKKQNILKIYLTYHDLFENNIGDVIDDIDYKMEIFEVFPILSFNKKESIFNLQYFKINNTDNLYKLIDSKIEDALKFQIVEKQNENSK